MKKSLLAKKTLIIIFSVLFVSLTLTSCTTSISSSSNSTSDSTSTTAPAKVLTDDVKAQLEAAADEVFHLGMAPGMMAVISVEGEGDYVIKRGVGNTVTGAPMDENDYWRIASNTKTFTGSAVLILVDEGKINLDSPINTYLPELSIPNGDKITVRMLGDMTSGLYNYSDDERTLGDLKNSNYLLTYTPEDLLKIAFSHPINFAPGEKYEYCNTNIVILGLLMQKVTGQSAPQVITDKVIKPMNLTHTYWPISLYLSAPYIHGYSADTGILLDATNWNPSWGYTAGQLVSNVADMKIWAKEVVAGTLLSAQTQAERFKWIDDHYGFCVMKAGNWIGHPGTIPGYNSHVFYNSDKKITMIVLTNTDTGTPVEYFSAAFRAILDK